MANEQNLEKGKETQFRAGEEQAKTAKKAGKASGKARRERKAMKDTLETLLSMSIDTGKVADIEEIQSLAALNGKNITVQDAIMLAQITKAIEGDTKAAEYVRDTSGNKFREEIDISGDMDLNITVTRK